MSKTEFVYTTYIKSTPEKVWTALTNPEFTKQYWTEGLSADWKKGAKWEAKNSKGACTIHGEVLESSPPKKLVISWGGRDEAKSDYSRVSFDIEAVGDMVCLNVIHADLKAGTETATRVSQGWPRVLCSLKSLLETGKALDTWNGVERDCEKAA